MSATLVSSNTTIKMNAAVAANTSAAGSTTLYTAPASGYAVVNLYMSASTGSVTVTVGGRTVASIAATNTVSYQSVFVGPSQALACSIGTGTVAISGVEFVNTP